MAKATKHPGPAPGAACALGAESTMTVGNKQVWGMLGVTGAPEKVDWRQRARYQVRVASLKS